MLWLKMKHNSLRCMDVGVLVRHSSFVKLMAMIFAFNSQELLILLPKAIGKIPP